MSGSDTEARKDLTSHFGAAVADHPDVMSECKFYPNTNIAKSSLIGLSMLRLYNLDPSALFFKYEAFVMSRPSGLRAKLSVLTLETARELKKEIQREHQAKAVSVAAGSHTHTETPKAGVGMRKGKGNMADLGGLYVSL
jgi:DNA polymerase alpha subunit B